MKKIDFFIRGEYVLPMTKTGECIHNGCVAVSGDSIVDIGKSADMKQIYEAKQVVDAGKGIVMPGLINVHTHAAMTMFRGMADDLPLQEWLNDHIWPAEAKYLNEEFIELASSLACLEFIGSGITCFNDMYFFQHKTGQAAEEAGLRAILGEVLLSCPTCSYRTMEEAFKIYEQQNQLFKNSKLIDVALAPHSVYATSKNDLRKIALLAKKKNCILHTHMSETKSEVDKCLEKHGMTPTHLLKDLGFFETKTVAAHGVWLDKQDIDILAGTSVSICHNPVSNMKLASGIAPVSRLLNKNVNICFGTDGAASNNTLDILSDLKTAALLQKVANNDPTQLPASDALMMATIGAAKAIGKENDIGSLQKGKKADIITIDLDKPHLSPVYDPFSHLVYCAGQNDVKDVMINGKMVMENRKIHTMDCETILSNANEMKKKLYEFE